MPAHQLVDASFWRLFHPVGDDLAEAKERVAAAGKLQGSTLLQVQYGDVPCCCASCAPPRLVSLQLAHKSCKLLAYKL